LALGRKPIGLMSAAFLLNKKAQPKSPDGEFRRMTAFEPFQ